MKYQKCIVIMSYNIIIHDGNLYHQKNTIISYNLSESMFQNIIKTKHVIAYVVSQRTVITFLIAMKNKLPKMLQSQEDF